MIPDPRPPGETGVELLGPAATAAITRAFQIPRLHVTLADIDVRREKRWIVLRVKFRKAPASDITIRISRAWATVLRNRLSKVLDR